jgi:negative regulator of sigma E activity
MEPLVTILEQHGLGVAMAVAVCLVAWFLLRHIINAQKEDRKIWHETLQKQQLLIENHLTHLTASSESTLQMLQHHDENSGKNSDNIVRAIDAQTNLMRAYFEKKGL